MSQKPIVMEQLKQILQLKSDGIAIREIARRIGISRNSVRKYVALLATDGEALSNTELADKAYSNDLLEHDAQRIKEVSQHFSSSGPELSKTDVELNLR